MVIDKLLIELRCIPSFCGSTCDLRIRCTKNEKEVISILKDRLNNLTKIDKHNDLSPNERKEIKLLYNNLD